MNKYRTSLLLSLLLLSLNTHAENNSSWNHVFIRDEMTDYIKTDRLELTGIVKHNGLNLSFIEPKLNLTYSCNYRELKLNKSNLKVSHFSLDLSFYDNKQNDYINQYIHIGNHKFKIRIDEEPFFYIQNDS